MQYKYGKKFNIDEINGLVHDENITVIGVDNPVEYTIKDNAPRPFTYGVKYICLLVHTNDTLYNRYNVVEGTYEKNIPFKGYDWLYALPETADTLIIVGGADHNELTLPDSETNLQALYSLLDSFDLPKNDYDKIKSSITGNTTLSSLVKSIEGVINE